jgi:hypothetical protein
MRRASCGSMMPAIIGLFIYYLLLLLFIYCLASAAAACGRRLAAEIK